MLRRHRHRPATLAACAILLILAVAAATALAAAKTISRDAAPSVANIINLRHGDLPTLKQKPNPITADQRKQSEQQAACIGEAPPSKVLTDLQSPEFVGPSPDQVTIDSEVQIQPDAATVAHDLAAIRQPKALRCLQSELVKAIATTTPKGSTYTVSIARLPATLPGTDGVAAVRVTAIFHIPQGKKKVTVPAYIDDIGFSYGQAEVSLNVISTLQPPSSSLETKLALLLVKRTREAIGSR